jgi:hypothetical protein
MGRVIWPSTYRKTPSIFSNFTNLIIKIQAYKNGICYLCFFDFPFKSVGLGCITFELLIYKCLKVEYPYT